MSVDQGDFIYIKNILYHYSLLLDTLHSSTLLYYYYNIIITIITIYYTNNKRDDDDGHSCFVAYSI